MASVLLIEDDPAQRLIAALALKKAGHDVREAAEGELGIAAAREQPPEVVVCDVMMPGISGYDVVAQLRADPQLATVPVILLTAMSARHHMRQGMVAGADDYLTKPYKPQELCDAVVAVLSRRQVQEQAFRTSLSGMVESALEQQKESLGRQYESQLQREISARWTRSANAAGDVHFARACVLLADLLAGSSPVPDAELAARLKQAQQAARDTFYLFGADFVLPYGSRLVAVFGGDEAMPGTPVELRVLRAAVALSKSVPRQRGLSIAIHTGPLSLLSVSDGLHGVAGHTLVPGDCVNTASAIEETAAALGWRIAASDPMVALLEDQAKIGRRVATERGEPAIEVLGLADA
jgi:DNA-binding response OmpR family regulator